MPYDTVITNGRWFDGTGAPSALRNIGVHDGRATTVAAGPLDTTGADVIDATGQVESYGGLSRMVNRNDDTVSAVLVSGQLAFSAGKAAPALGKQRFGQFLRAGRPSRKLTPTA
jgi:N-acyl-D-aspartate/D-glutamate deacylase